MEFTAKQIAQFIQGRVEGDENASINTFAKIEEGVPGAISFLSNPKYIQYIYDTKSSVVLIDESLNLEKPVTTTLIRVKDSRDSVAKLLQLYAAAVNPPKQGIADNAYISPKAKIKAEEWKKQHPEFGLARAQDMLKWQKEHPEKMLKIR